MRLTPEPNIAKMQTVMETEHDPDTLHDSDLAQCDWCDKVVDKDSLSQGTDDAGDPDGDAVCSECVLRAWEVARGTIYEPVVPEELPDFGSIEEP